MGTSYICPIRLPAKELENTFRVKWLSQYDQLCLSSPPTPAVVEMLPWDLMLLISMLALDPHCLICQSSNQQGPSLGRKMEIHSLNQTQPTPSQFTFLSQYHIEYTHNNAI